MFGVREMLFVLLCVRFGGCERGAEVQSKSIEASKSSKQTDNGLMSKILPLLITPFLISSALIPPMLLSIKVLLIKSLIVGKIAVILMILSFIRRRMTGGGVFNHHVAQEHYGYQGVDEPGAYVHLR